jgi:hypothetical protein
MSSRARVTVRLCERCTQQLKAWRNRFDERTMAAMVGQILQRCPECASQLPPTEGTLFTKLPVDFEPDFTEPRR